MIALGMVLLISAENAQADPAIDLSLQQARITIQLLDEVIVVGYGALKKINLTGSVATVSAEQITSRAMPNLSASLSGLAPGVRVMQGRGTPGDESVSIQIRGMGPINSSSRAANGVVLVTNKKGRREKPRVTASSLIEA